MTATISDLCIRCGACEFECPAQAILPSARHPVVDTQACTECFGFFPESQCHVVCPVGAISLTGESIEVLSRRYDSTRPDRPPTDVTYWLEGRPG